MRKEEEEEEEDLSSPPGLRAPGELGGAPWAPGQQTAPRAQQERQPPVWHAEQRSQRLEDSSWATLSQGSLLMAPRRTQVSCAA